jgi:type 1 glutamine amidotransferase
VPPNAGNGGAAGQRGGAGGSAGMGNGGSGGSASPSLLVFSKTAGYRHESIPNGLQAIATLARDRGWTQMATENASIFSDTGLAPFNVIVFLSTSGDVFDDSQQAAFERYIRSGRGFVGVHSASTTEYDWPFFGELIGAYFREHPDVQPATIVVEDATHPSTSSLPMRWTRTDEWYAFQTNPRANVEVLLSLDETSYTPGTSSMGADHPIAWYQVYESARSFQTALGHTQQSYTEPLFLAHLAGGIEWAAGR